MSGLLGAEKTFVKLAALLGGKKRDEALFDEMRKAVNNNDPHMMRKFIADKDFKINSVGGHDKRTVLHTAEQGGIGHPDIGTNAM